MEIVTIFVETGECTVDTNAVVANWNKNCFISQWHDKYTLVMQDEEVKVVINKRQAKEIIVELDLMPEQSPIFTNGKTWK